MTPSAPRDHSDELFCGNDGGGGPYWLTAKGRSVAEAVAIVESVETLEGVHVEMVTGRIDESSGEPRVVLDGDGPLEFWEIEA